MEPDNSKNPEIRNSARLSDEFEYFRHLDEDEKKKQKRREIMKQVAEVEEEIDVHTRLRDSQAKSLGVHHFAKREKKPNSFYLLSPFHELLENPREKVLKEEKKKRLELCEKYLENYCEEGESRLRYRKRIEKMIKIWNSEEIHFF